MGFCQSLTLLLLSASRYSTDRLKHSRIWQATMTTPILYHQDSSCATSKICFRSSNIETPWWSSTFTKTNLQFSHLKNSWVKSSTTRRIVLNGLKLRWSRRSDNSKKEMKRCSTGFISSKRPTISMDRTFSHRTSIRDSHTTPKSVHIANIKMTNPSSWNI